MVSKCPCPIPPPSTNPRSLHYIALTNRQTTGVTSSHNLLCRCGKKSSTSDDIYTQSCWAECSVHCLSSNAFQCLSPLTIVSLLSWQRRQQGSNATWATVAAWDGHRRFGGGLRQTDRQTDRQLQADRQAKRQTDRQTDIDAYGQRQTPMAC